MDGMPRENHERFDDKAYNQLVRQWEAVSRTLDLLSEHDITLLQNEQWHRELEAKAFELSVREQALTHDRALPSVQERAWFRAAQDERGLRAMRADLAEHQAELDAWERDTKQAFAEQFPGYPYTHEGIAEAIASLKPLEADLRMQIDTYHDRSPRQVGEQRMKGAIEQFLELRAEAEWQNQRAEREHIRTDWQQLARRHENVMGGVAGFQKEGEKKPLRDLYNTEDQSYTVEQQQERADQNKSK